MTIPSIKELLVIEPNGAVNNLLIIKRIYILRQALSTSHIGSWMETCPARGKRCILF